MRSAFASVVIAALSATLAGAQSNAVPPASSGEMHGRKIPATPMPPPAPAPEMAQLELFQGRWSCSGHVPQTIFGPSHPTVSQVGIALDLDGFWYVGTVDEQKTPENAHPMHGRLQWTYDRSRRVFVSHWIDSAGGEASQTSSGWKGNKMTWDGSMIVMGRRMAARDSFEKAADGQMLHGFEAQIGDQWTSLGTEVCRKAP